MKAKEMRGLDQTALDAELSKNQRDLINLRCQVALGEEVHPHQVRQTRREIARLQTVMREASGARGEK